MASNERGNPHFLSDQPQAAVRSMCKSLCCLPALRAIPRPACNLYSLAAKAAGDKAHQRDVNHCPKISYKTGRAEATKVAMGQHNPPGWCPCRQKRFDLLAGSLVYEW